MTISRVLLLIAVILFILGGLGVSVGFNLLFWGLAFFSGSFLL